jgi:dTDP-glucose 4,6-dehydratase
MIVLITGAAGFLGSHLCDRLLREGHQVVGMDNFITGNSENLAHLAGNQNFLFIRHDVSNFIFVPGRLDAVLHFASPASPNESSPLGYINLPIQTMKAGALGTHNTLGIARANDARFLLASTSEIYGDPIGKRSVYDEAKRFAEALTMAYHRFHGLDTRIARIFNTYGPRMHIDDGRVVPNFLQQALRMESLTVYGDGVQTRSFCYVDDMVDGIYRLLISEEHEPINIGNPIETSIHDLALIINDLTKNPAGIVSLERKRGPSDPQRRRPDISRARNKLNWEPKISLDEGIKRTTPYFKDKLGLV